MLLPEKLLVLAPSITEPHIAILETYLWQARQQKSAETSMWSEKLLRQQLLVSVYCEGHVPAGFCVLVNSDKSLTGSAIVRLSNTELLLPRQQGPQLLGALLSQPAQYRASMAHLHLYVCGNRVRCPEMRKNLTTASRIAAGQ